MITKENIGELIEELTVVQGKVDGLLGEIDEHMFSIIADDCEHRMRMLLLELKYYKQRRWGG